MSNFENLGWRLDELVDRWRSPRKRIIEIYWEWYYRRHPVLGPDPGLQYWMREVLIKTTEWMHQEDRPDLLASLVPLETPLVSRREPWLFDYKYRGNIQ